MRIQTCLAAFVSAVPLAVAGGCDYDKPAPRTAVADVLVVEQQDAVVAPGDSTPATTPDVAEEPLDVETPWVHPPVVGVEGGDDEALPIVTPDEPLPAPTRGRQRMDIDQLDRAFSDVLGGITWTTRVGSVDVNQFQVLAKTLGKPDFLQVTFEDLAPTSLFAKFLNDAARKACSDRVARDLAIMDAGGAGEVPILFGPLGVNDTVANAPTQVDTQLGALLLRFHGRQMAPETAAFGEWRWLFEASTQIADSTATAWQAVCVALILHPDFYTY